MNNFTKETINNLADKLLIGLTEEENELVLSEFDIIDKTCDIVNSIANIKDIEPMTHTLDDFVVELRSDVAEESVPITELLRNAGYVSTREIEIPKVVE